MAFVNDACIASSRASRNLGHCIIKKIGEPAPEGALWLVESLPTRRRPQLPTHVQPEHTHGINPLTVFCTLLARNPVPEAWHMNKRGKYGAHGQGLSKRHRTFAAYWLDQLKHTIVLGSAPHHRESVSHSAPSRHKLPRPLCIIVDPFSHPATKSNPHPTSSLSSAANTVSKC
jgi:hypothetical protein